ncbi:chromosome partitioning protein [Streptomyces abyssalis]|uniref:Chromosome partitioning protein n=1 Tax=Streptomyces abyssalis TaxID=933944 RepID=A0A1E7JQ66_9ACTN|nr:AAA family ATPase [Streptomyces abyssalis]OEU90432.1 chromosome partitioning protein [Streptomyces abyssalis]OEU95168.1 chromosome partitioning protein [Streptomyces abyssalis]
MTSIALFNNKGGVGKTTLTYHLAHMFRRLGLRVLAVDLDPQANLTSMCLDESEIEELWEDRTSELIAQGAVPPALPGFSRVRPGQTIADAVKPILEGTGDIAPVEPAALMEELWLLPGSLDLSRFEDKLSMEWSRTFAGDMAAIRTTTAFHRSVAQARESVQADIVLLDVGPNLGAINRAALIAADTVLMPLAADLFSLKGLTNLGPTLRNWRRDWRQLVLPRIPEGFQAPNADMTPLGYVIMQPEMRLDRPVKAYERWLRRIPWVFSAAVLDQQPPSRDDTRHRIATLRNYRSLMPLAHDARKPMFDLKPADGALGSTQQYVQTCFREFRALAEAILSRLEYESRSRSPK